MLFLESQLRSCKLTAFDGEIGSVDEFYFDDQLWTMMYAVAKTGGWLNERRLLLSPQSLSEPDFKNQKLPVNLTRQRIEQSPPTAFENTIDEIHENELALHYGWASFLNFGN